MSTQQPLTASAVTLAADHQAAPLAPAAPYAAPIVVTPGVLPAAPAVQTVQLPDGRIVTGYALTHTAPPAPAPDTRPAVSPLALNLALGGVGFAAICAGLFLAASFLAALAALVHQLVILAAVIFGGFVAVQVFGHSRGAGGITVNAKKAVFKRNTFRG